MNAPNISEEYINNRRIVIGVRLQAARLKKGLTIDQVSEISGISRNNLARIEDGKWNWDAKFFILYLYAIEGDIEVITK